MEYRVRDSLANSVAFALKVFSRCGASPLGGNRLRLSGGNQLFAFRLPQLRELHAIDVPRQAKFFEGPNAIPVQIEFIPLQAMTGGNWVSVMIIVPPFAKADQSNPKIVRRKVARDKPPRSPGVSAGVDQPRAMQDDHCAQEHSPENEGQAAERE